MHLRAQRPCDLLLYWEGTALRGGTDAGCPGRARDFRCVVDHAADGDMKQPKGLTTIDVDDQGGEADIAWPDGRRLTFIVHRRAFTSPLDREFALYRIHEAGRRAATSPGPG